MTGSGAGPEDEVSVSSISRGTRPALAVLAGAALALVPSAALAGNGTTTAAPVAATVSEHVSAASQQGSVHIVSPREGQVVSPGTVIISGRAAPGETVVSHYSLPDGDSGQGPVADADIFGNWTMSINVSAPGTYQVSVRNISTTGWDSVRFTVG